MEYMKVLAKTQLQGYMRLCDFFVGVISPAKKWHTHKKKKKRCSQKDKNKRRNSVEKMMQGFYSSGCWELWNLVCFADGCNVMKEQLLRPPTSSTCFNSMTWIPQHLLAPLVKQRGQMMTSVFAAITLVRCPPPCSHDWVHAHTHTHIHFCNIFTASFSFSADPEASACPSLTNTQQHECSMCPGCHHKREAPSSWWKSEFLEMHTSWSKVQRKFENYIQ